MKLWHWAITSAVMAFCLPFVAFNIYLRYNLIQTHGSVKGKALWRQWKL